MDQSEHMSTNPSSTMGRSGVIGLFQIRDPSTARKAIDIVSIFKSKLSMADGWFRTLGRLYKHIMRTKRKLRSHYKIPDPFSPTETFKGALTLLPLRMGKEDYKTLDAVFGVASEDTEMVDADNGGKAADGPSRLDRWNAINAGSTTPGASGSQNGLVSPYPPALTPVSAASQSLGTSGIPAVSPTPVSPAVPPFTPASIGSAGDSTAQTAPFSPVLQKTPTQQAPVAWTGEQVQAWVDALETKFTAYDVAAFVEGRECKDTAGWLGLIWE
jgi:hypothetical protein